MIEMVGLIGFEEAIIGTALRGSHQVLAYDAELVVSMLDEFDTSVKDLSGIGELFDLSSLGEQAPIFIYLDKTVIDEVQRGRVLQQH